MWRERDSYTRDENGIWNTFEEPDQGKNSSADGDNDNETNGILWTETPQVLGRDLTQSTTTTPSGIV